MWIGSYRRGKDDTVYIEHTRTSECPTSILTPEIEFMLSEAESNRLASANGGTMYGPDSRRWPAWWSDLLTVVTREREHVNALLGIPANA